MGRIPSPPPPSTYYKWTPKSWPACSIHPDGCPPETKPEPVSMTKPTADLGGEREMKLED